MYQYLSQSNSPSFLRPQRPSRMPNNQVDKEKGAISQDSAQKHPGVVREELLLHKLT